MKRIFRPIKEGFIGFFRHFSVSLSSVAVVTFTMVFLGLILLITDNINVMTKNIEADIEIWVPIKFEYEDQYETIKTELEAMPIVESVEYITKQQDLDEYIAIYGEEYEFLRAEENPMHDSFKVRVTEGRYFDQLVQEVRAMPWAQRVEDGGQAVGNLIESLSAIRFGGSIFTIALLVLAVFLISNTIKLSIYSRQDEIEIMRIVGATNSFIRSPFLIEGLLIGLFGSLIPIAVVIFGYRFLLDSGTNSSILSMLTLSPAMPLIQNVSLILLATSLIVGLVGSYLSVTKHLRWTR